MLTVNSSPITTDIMDGSTFTTVSLEVWVIEIGIK